MERAFSKDRLIIFGRYPSPGSTKTRLIPALGPLGAANLQRCLTEKILIAARTFAARHEIAIECCFEGGNPQKIRRWLGPVPRVTFQDGGDLGRRMRGAIFNAFHEGCGRVVLVGTDIPDLNPQVLAEAFEALPAHDAVVGPSADGGYWLMGLKRPVDLFRNIDWGSPQVFARTMAQVRRKGLTFKTLESLSDLDSPEDLKNWKGMESLPEVYLSVVIPTLNEEDHIRKSVLSAVNRDAEVIVADGGSTDGTVSLAKSAGARVVQNLLGRAQQQNRGAAAARGENLLFLHGDTLLPKDYLREVFEILMGKETVLGAFRFKTDFHHPFMGFVEWMTHLRSRYLQLPYGDQALFMKKATFEKAGGFPAVPIGEDLFLVRQLVKRQNARVTMTKGAAVTSGRRWKRRGPFKTTWINQLMLFGMALGVSRKTLSRLYRSSG